MNYIHYTKGSNDVSVLVVSTRISVYDTVSFISGLKRNKHVSGRQNEGECWRAKTRYSIASVTVF